ncbi:sialidase family protein [Pseudonocardia humida]|uniref:Exo-alpha-sialidase n=1 Tax=Pseudonocardia humida TaxID=2800819 RepID=A0ABT1AA52_9PSEU|nr:sialidase family protein [Pseudonocardia humida]MCO1659873.1 exo-alpha-sialidase [Pseudonocardia humida]
MTRRWAALVAAALVLCAAAGCGRVPAEPEPIRFVAVELPGGARPQVLAAAGDDLLIGVRRDDGPTLPGVLRRAQDGRVTEIPTRPASPYGRTAAWYSLVTDGERVLGIGGDRGGAHGNVRWSVWSGGPAGISEQAQAFSTFGGWGAGDLVGAALTPSGPALVGTWQSTGAGLDVALWTAVDDTWTRHDPTGTPLASTGDLLGFPTAATGSGPGILVVGWQYALGPEDGQQPVVWRSDAGGEGWTRTALPDSGSAGTAVAARCSEGTCLVVGRVDGEVALWRSTAGTWTRVPGVPPIGVGDDDPLPAPLPSGQGWEQFVSDGGRLKVVTGDGSGTAVRPVEGPTGAVSAAVRVGGSVYLLAGPDPASPQLWCADAAAFGDATG